MTMMVTTTSRVLAAIAVLAFTGCSGMDPEPAVVLFTVADASTYVADNHGPVLSQPR